MPRVLVTGGAGFIGSHVCSALVAAGAEVVAVDPLRTYSFSFSPQHWHGINYRRDTLLRDANVVVASTENRDEMRRVMLDTRPDAILHLGALPLATVARVSADHAFESILRGTFNLVELRARGRHHARSSSTSPRAWSTATSRRSRCRRRSERRRRIRTAA